MVAAPAVLTSPGSLNLPGSCRDFSSEARRRRCGRCNRARQSAARHPGDVTMAMIPRGMQIPARWRLLACGLFLMASCSIAAGADEGIVDVHALPQLEGAVEDISRPDPYSVEYRVPTRQAVTLPAVQKLLSDNGWVPYVMPLEEKSSLLKFRKGRQGLSVHFTQAPGRPDQSVVYYTTDRIYGNVPFPEGASDIVFDGTRPYLGCIAPTPLDPTSDFYASQMAAIGWQKLTPETAARWTTSLDETVPNGVRAFYAHVDSKETGFYQQKPVMLTLTRRDDGRTHVDIRVAPFALPSELKADSDLGRPAAAEPDQDGQGPRQRERQQARNVGRRDGGAAGRARLLSPRARRARLAGGRQRAARTRRRGRDQYLFGGGNRRAAAWPQI